LSHNELRQGFFRARAGCTMSRYARVPFGRKRTRPPPRVARASVGTQGNRVSAERFHCCWGWP
jgi:hypothetical protein